METFQILQTTALCGGALALAWIAIRVSVIADYMHHYMTKTGMWNDDDPFEEGR
jgi:hypothetical protein